MTSWPRVHTASAAVSPEGQTAIAGPEPAAVTTAGFQLGGLGDMGSPETLVVSALAWSFATAFRTEMARASLHWDALELSVDGTIDRNRRWVRFSRFDIHLTVDAPANDREPLGQTAERALAGCLVAHSLAGETRLAINIRAREDISGHRDTARADGRNIASHA
jgi:organic hydroperoxide reductase OsmC/OhrA